MSRTLRPRQARVNYSALAGVDNDVHDPENSKAGPSNTVDDSGSDFDVPHIVNLPEDDPMTENEDDELDNEDPVALQEKEPTPARGKGKKAKKRTNTSTLDKPQKSAISDHPVDGLTRKSKRPPAPSANHRHRAPPLFSRTGQVERLTAPPQLFTAPSNVLTNNYTHTQRVTRKLNLLWGQNVGPGPIWELAEDRAWYKEANTTDDVPERDSQRRPRVYQNIRVMQGLEILTDIDAKPYLPGMSSALIGAPSEPAVPLTCFFGPFDEQQSHTLPMFANIKTPQSGSHVFNAGAPVWGLDWCPIHSDDRTPVSFKQYLAVAPFPSKTHSPGVGVRVARPALACIQIWSLADDNSSSSGKVACELVLCMQSGPVLDLKWCPLPANDRLFDAGSSPGPRKLGILGGVFEDGSLSVFAVPYPSDLSDLSSESSSPIFAKIPEPLLRIELEQTAITAFDWANSELLAVGNSHGSIAVYNVGQALCSLNGQENAPITGLSPTHYIPLHQSAIRSLTWIKSPPSSVLGEPRTDEDPTVLVTGGYDGSQCVTDIREGHGTVVNRTRDVINTVAYSPYDSAFMSVDHENIVKGYSISPSMLGRGHILADCDGPVWHMHGSEYHPQLAVGCADGFCMTTNMLRATRRGTIPFFVHRIYQLDYNRKTGALRMLEQFLPKELTIQTASGNAGKGKRPLLKTVGTDAWPQEVGIHRVVWNNGNGLSAAGMLASGTASGLCRIDLLAGRWNKDRTPPNLNEVRGEVDGSEDDLGVEDESGMDE
ncbi:hypothetical protein HGRIS_012644 [Hohenbuehelia grisea]|uniref:Uncharacterized protein n=1 Tax=Hohenbuehelia grisea TaxID=104357 RepID=A0ABR3IT76_9AGAR